MILLLHIDIPFFENDMGNQDREESTCRMKEVGGLHTPLV
jgi:hypothetical protein